MRPPTTISMFACSLKKTSTLFKVSRPLLCFGVVFSIFSLPKWFPLVAFPMVVTVTYNPVAVQWINWLWCRHRWGWHGNPPRHGHGRGGHSSAAEISASRGSNTWTIISINAVDNAFFILACSMVANAVSKLIKLRLEQATYKNALFP